jgi:hypothetical protein
LGHYAIFFEVLATHPMVGSEATCGICGNIKQDLLNIVLFYGNFY